jgi:hypothetical protein
MSTGWIWAIWTVVMLGWSYVALEYDLGPYEVMIFIVGGMLLSAGAMAFQRTTRTATSRF